ncbi:MAG TPA: FkbM family methyltransferase [Nitrospiraceae bacterium]|nr:FkbM family methyltransferase [Nitrospiraceae bacterium]
MIRNLAHRLKRALNRSDSERSSVDLQSDASKEKLWEETTAFYSQFVKAGDLCFDVGANIGSKTNVLLELGARVVCIEPQPNCVDVLKSKYQKNSSVVIVPKGLAAQPGRRPLSICGAADTISTFSEKWKTGRFCTYAWEPAVDVPVTTLDSLIREFGSPKFCKIDVEGFEYEVLQGLSAPISFLAFEFTQEFIGEAKLCIEHLGTLGCTDFNYALGETPALLFSDWVDENMLFQSIRQYTNDLLWGDIYVRFHR